MDFKSHKGVTLTELIVTITIMAIIITPISIVFIQGYSGFFIESDKMNAQQCAREALYGKGVNSYGIMGDLERCDNTLTSTGSKSITIGDTSGSAVYYLVGEELMYKKSTDTEGKNYFSDNPKVKIMDFQVNLSQSGITLPGIILQGIETDTTIASISITVDYGKAKDVKLTSSFRFPKLD